LKKAGAEVVAADNGRVGIDLVQSTQHRIGGLSRPIRHARFVARETAFPSRSGRHPQTFHAGYPAGAERTIVGRESTIRFAAEPVTSPALIESDGLLRPQSRGWRTRP
jgi:hypothetical protein